MRNISFLSLLILCLTACSQQALVGTLQGLSTGLTQYGRQTANVNYTQPVAYTTPTTYQRIGNTVYSSNGTSYQKVGNTVYGSDGTQCRKVGTTVYCN